MNSASYHCQRLVHTPRPSSSTAVSVAAHCVPTMITTPLPCIQALFPDATWTWSSSSPTAIPPPPPPATRTTSAPTTQPPLSHAYDTRCRSPPSYPYRKCLLDVTITPTKTIIKRLDIPLTKPRKPLSLFDLLSVDAALSAASEKKQFEKPSVHVRRQCGISDCAKYALSGGFCIRHGGGKRCNYDGCQTVAQSGGLCKAHGGGSKCRVADCGNVARRKGFCMSHGGRQPCKVDGCSKCAHGGGLCISHGGGKRCASLECVKSAQAGGFCYSHGGGKRCSAPQCFQAARKGGLCIRHRKASS